MVSFVTKIRSQPNSCICWNAIAKIILKLLDITLIANHQCNIISRVVYSYFKLASYLWHSCLWTHLQDAVSSSHLSDK